jgi:hypothetical protein
LEEYERVLMLMILKIYNSMRIFTSLSNLSSMKKVYDSCERVERTNSFAGIWDDPKTL